MTIITLPRSMVKEINDEVIKLEIPDEYYIVNKKKLARLDETYGILKDSAIDPVEYQKKARGEWDRNE